MLKTQKKMSVRAVAMQYGLPAGVVSRAVNTGDLAATLTITETGRKRLYISINDADAWFNSLASSGGSK